MKMVFNAIGMASVAATLAFASSASATVYNSRATFLTALSSSSTVTFDNLAPNGGVTPYGTTAIIEGVTFVDTEVNLVDANFALGAFPSSIQYGSDYLEWEGSDPSVLTITLPSLYTAVGFDFTELRGRAAPFTFVVDGVSTTVNGTMPIQFFGYTSATAFSTLTISLPFQSGFDIGNYGSIDNFTYGNVGGGGVVPEPATWAMMIIGFGAAGSMIRRRKAVVA